MHSVFKISAPKCWNLFLTRNARMAQKPRHTEFLAEHGNPRKLTPSYNSKFKTIITSIAGVTMIVISTLTCTLITRYLLYAPCVGKDIPSFRRGLGRLRRGFSYFYLSLCKTDSYNGICRTCYSSILKNDGYQKDYTYLCKQRKKKK